MTDFILKVIQSVRERKVMTLLLMGILALAVTSRVVTFQHAVQPVIATTTATPGKNSSSKDAQKDGSEQLINLAVNKNMPLPVCLSILAYQGQKTLDRTLESYNTSGLFHMVSEWHILFQKIDSKGRELWAADVVRRYPMLNPIYEKSNTGQKEGFSKLARACSQPYSMILEEDFYVGAVAEPKEQLEHGVWLLQHDVAHAVRFRHRTQAGDPNYLKISFDRHGYVASSHLIAHLYWNDIAELNFTEISVCQRQPKTWCVASAHAHYTNNPTLYRSNFSNWLFNQAPETEEFEPWLTAFWRQQNFTVAWSDGIFTHDRLDRDFGYIDPSLSITPPDVDEISVSSTATSKLKNRVKRSTARPYAQSEGSPRHSNHARKPVKRTHMWKKNKQNM
jgi:hypothetical protein